jgi:hypothetical protein
MTDNLCLIAPAGLLKGLPLLGQLVKLPVVGTFLMHLTARHLIKRLALKSHYGNPALSILIN